MAADRQTSIDFWEGLLGMPYYLESAIMLTIPNEGQSVLDTGDGRFDHHLLPMENRKPVAQTARRPISCVHPRRVERSNRAMFRPGAGSAQGNAGSAKFRRQGSRVQNAFGYFKDPAWNS